MITKEYLQQELAKRIDGYKRGVATSTDNIIAEMKSILVLVDALPNYEKKYNHALEVVRELQKDWASTQNRAAREIELAFPELRESEDEKTRKELLNFVKSFWADHKEKLPQTSRWVTYLEKQKEQKPAEKQDYSGLNDLERAILRGFLCAGVENVPVGIIKDTAYECMGFLALIEPNPAEWSEEDEENIDSLIIILHKALSKGISCKEELLDLTDWLKSLRPNKQD